ncbi:MAG: hypothetical protein HY536_00415 [Candidatus Colwellbacteria bacterium]|nr:hypothetical protein [Candidatus Colwellbacteria bacterium]
MDKQFDIGQLERLLTEDKRGDAAALLAGWLSGDLSEEEKGELYLGAVMAYLGAVRRMSEGYGEALGEMLATTRQCVEAQKVLRAKSEELALREGIEAAYESHKKDSDSGGG